MPQRLSIYRVLFLLGVANVLSCNQAPPAPVVVADEAAPTTVALQKKSEQPASVVKPVAPVASAKTEPVPAKGTFAFPDDTGGQLLAKMLPPGNPPTLSAATNVAPRERTLPAFLESPTLPLTDAASSPAMLRSPEGKTALPNALPDRVPLELAPPMPTLPERTPLPTGPLTRDVGRDVNVPADLPYLSPFPIPDRAPLADPTVEFTAQSVISIVLPLRSEPTGFLRFTLPDPFENSAGRSSTTVPDDPNRALGSPPPPRP